MFSKFQVAFSLDISSLDDGFRNQPLGVQESRAMLMDSFSFILTLYM